MLALWILLKLPKTKRGATPCINQVNAAPAEEKTTGFPKFYALRAQTKKVFERVGMVFGGLLRVPAGGVKTRLGKNQDYVPPAKVKKVRNLVVGRPLACAAHAANVSLNLAVPTAQFVTNDIV